MEEPQPLGGGLLGEPIDASRVAARPRQAGDEIELDWIVGYPEDDRDRPMEQTGPGARR
jgi:hypothetical protein